MKSSIAFIDFGLELDSLLLSAIYNFSVTVHSATSLFRPLLHLRAVPVRAAQGDGRTLKVRKSTLAEPDLMAIYRALGVDPAPGGSKKILV